MRCICFLNARGRKLLKRLRRKEFWRSRKISKVQVNTSIFSIIIGFSAVIIAVVSIIITSSSSREQSEINKKIENNLDSLTALTGKMLETQIFNTRPQISFFEEKFETDKSIYFMYWNEKIMFPKYEISYINVGNRDLSNLRVYSSIYFPVTKRVYHHSEKELKDCRNRETGTFSFFPPIPIRDYRNFHIKFQYKWFDSDLSKEDSTDIILNFRKISDNRFYISPAHPITIKRLENYELEFNPFTISRLELSVFREKFYNTGNLSTR